MWIGSKRGITRCFNDIFHLKNIKYNFTFSRWKWNVPPALTPRNCLNNNLSEQIKLLFFSPPNNRIAYEIINMSFQTKTQACKRS